MKITDFKIGDRFYTGSGEWLCVDVGVKFVLAIKNDAIKNYREGESSGDIVVFDHWDFGGCWR